MVERRLSVDGLTTRVLEDGTGPLVMLLHGGAMGCSADDWCDALAPIAAAGFRALAFDSPGFGACDPAPDVSLAFRSRYGLGVQDVLGIERATLVGHSQAGRLVVMAAEATPQRVAAGVVVCTGSLLPPLDGAAGGERAAAVREPTPAETRAMLEAYVYDRTSVTDALVEQFQHFSRANLSNAVRRAAEAAPDSGPPAWARLGELSPPLMLVFGADDRGNVPERIVLARARYPQMPIRLLERCGHFAQWDQLDAVTGLITSFARP